MIRESTPTERAALLTYQLLTGQQMTTTEAAQLLQVSQRTAQRMLSLISRTVPVYRDDISGRWVADDGDGAQISPY